MGRQHEFIKSIRTYLCLLQGKALLSIEHILETNTITGASSDELHARKSEGETVDHREFHTY